MTNITPNNVLETMAGHQLIWTALLNLKKNADRVISGYEELAINILEKKPEDLSDTELIAYIITAGQGFGGQVEEVAVSKRFYEVVAAEDDMMRYSMALSDLELAGIVQRFPVGQDLVSSVKTYNLGFTELFEAQVNITKATIVKGDKDGLADIIAVVTASSQRQKPHRDLTVLDYVFCAMLNDVNDINDMVESTIIGYEATGTTHEIPDKEELRLLFNQAVATLLKVGIAIEGDEGIRLAGHVVNFYRNGIYPSTDNIRHMRVALSKRQDLVGAKGTTHAEHVRYYDEWVSVICSGEEVNLGEVCANPYGVLAYFAIYKGREFIAEIISSVSIRLASDPAYANVDQATFQTEVMKAMDRLQLEDIVVPLSGSPTRWALSKQTKAELEKIRQGELDAKVPASEEDSGQSMTKVVRRLMMHYLNHHPSRGFLADRLAIEAAVFQALASSETTVTASDIAEKIFSTKDAIFSTQADMPRRVPKYVEETLTAFVLTNVVYSVEGQGDVFKHFALTEEALAAYQELSGNPELLEASEEIPYPGSMLEVNITVKGVKFDSEKFYQLCQMLITMVSVNRSRRDEPTPTLSVSGVTFTQREAREFLNEVYHNRLMSEELGRMPYGNPINFWESDEDGLRPQRTALYDSRSRQPLRSRTPFQQAADADRANGPFPRSGGSSDDGMGGRFRGDYVPDANGGRGTGRERGDGNGRRSR